MATVSGDDFNGGSGGNVRRTRACIDPGWLGDKGIPPKSGSFDGDSPKTIAVEGTYQDYVLFCAVEDGEIINYWRRDVIGFVR